VQVGRILIGVGGGLIFAASLLYFAARYAYGFDESPAAAAGGFSAATFDIILFTLFAMHHSVFARTGLKAAIKRAMAPELERSVYVWTSSVLFIAVCAFWKPIAGVAWNVSGGGAYLLRGLQIAGAVFTVVSARHLDVLDLSGVRQALTLPSSRPVKLDDHGPYAVVRHPIYLGWLFLVWPAPFMNGTRLVFAAISTLYLVAAIPFEERDLHRSFGHAYAQYAAKIRYKLIPGLY
jgi:protein-S-isoprenylcysteine O-methyltransferase Ste14